MRLNNAYKTQTHTLKINQFKGVDHTRSRDTAYAESSFNINLENGIPVKRKGWKEIKTFNGEIKGIAEISLSGYQGILYVADKSFYFDDGDKTILLPCPEDVIFANDQNTRLTAFYHKDRYYLIGLGDYLTLGDWGSGLEIKRVADSPDCYVPTTTIGISSIGGSFYRPVELDENSIGVYYVKDGSTFTRVVLDGETVWSKDETYYNLVSSNDIEPIKIEEGNVLNPFRKNTLFGSVDQTSSYKLDVDSLDNDGSSIVYVETVGVDGNIENYVLRESARSNVSRNLEVGDNLSGKTLNVSQNQTQINCSVLRNGSTMTGRTVLKGKNIHVFWFDISEDKSFNNAVLLMNYRGENSYLSEELAFAQRANSYSPYTVVYQTKDVTLSNSIEYTVDQVDIVAGFDLQVKATLPDYVYDLYDDDQNNWGNIDHKNAVITFTRSIPAKDYEDNITVLFKSHFIDVNADDVNGCRFGSFFGVDGNVDRLFLSGDPLKPNWDFCSGTDDPTYFPYDGISVLGQTTSPISGYVRLSDSTQAILKKNADNDSTVYVRYGTWVTNQIKLGAKNYYLKKAEFSIVGSYVAEGCVTPFAVGNFGREPLFLSDRGLYTIKTSENKATESRFTVERGAKIDEELSKMDKSNAFSILNDGKYYLFINDLVYICDEKNYSMIDGVKSYDFWVWNNIPASFATVIDGKIRIGTKDGKILSFYDGYSDESYHYLNNGEISFTQNSFVLDLAEGADIRQTDVIVFQGEVYTKLFSDCVVLDGKIKADVLDLGEIEVYADNVGNSGLEVNKAYTICEIDLDENTFALKDDQTIDLLTGGFDLYIKLKNRELYVRDFSVSLDDSQNDRLTLSLYPNGKRIKINAYNGVMPENSSAKIIRREPVVAEWRSKESDLGSDNTIKTIRSIGINVGGESQGRIKALCFGGTDGFLSFGTTDKMRLNDLNFAKIGFNGSLNKNFNSRVMIKDVNFFRLTLISDEAKPFALKDISVEFIYTKKNRGLK